MSSALRRATGSGIRCSKRTDTRTAFSCPIIAAGSKAPSVSTMPDHSFEAEDKMIRKITAATSGFGDIIEVRNQARVHLWYEASYAASVLDFKV